MRKEDKLPDEPFYDEMDSTEFPDIFAKLLQFAVAPGAKAPESVNQVFPPTKADTS